MPHTIQGDLSPTRRAVPKKTETSAGEDEKKRKYLCTIDWNGKWYSHYGKQGGCSSSIKTELPYDPAVPPLGSQQKKMKSLSRSSISTVVFTAALFTGAKTWKQLECPAMDK